MPSPDRRDARAAALVAALATLGTVPVARAASDPILSLSISESSSGAPAAARLSVTRLAGPPLRPEPDSLGFFHDPLGGFFYAESLVAIEATDESLRIRAAKGPEFRDVDRWVTVDGDTTLALSLERWIDMRALGWVSGDVHAHLAHAPFDYHLDVAEGAMMARAEGLHTVTFLEDNGTYFTGSIDAASDARLAAFVGAEYRSAFFGHMGLLGIDTPVTASGGEGWPLTAATSIAVRSHGAALSVFAHPITTTNFWGIATWPGTGLGRGLWVDAGLGALDALDVASYSNGASSDGLAFATIERLWNAGFRVPVSAGTDAVMCNRASAPLGGSRVYARVPDAYAPPQALYDSWVEAHRMGRTFVSTGPLLTAFHVGVAGVGETLSVASGEPLDVPVTAQVASAYGLGAVEVVVNGEVVQSVLIPGATSIAIDVEVPIRETSWVTVRHVAPSQAPFAAMPYAVLLATPALVRLGDDALTSADDAAFALSQIDLLDSLLTLSASYPWPSESLAVRVGIDAARAAWAACGAAAPTAFHLQSPAHEGVSVVSFPQLRWGSAASGGAAPQYRLVLALDAAFDSVVVDTSWLADTTWSSAALSGIGASYWWRVQARDPSGQWRWSEEVDRTFTVIASPPVDVADAGRASEAAGAGAAPRLSIAPNPSRGPVTLQLSAPAPPGATLRLFDAQGREVRALRVPHGAHEISWDAADAAGRPAASGVYCARLDAGGAATTRVVTIVR
jgi:hypothetical protein